MQGKTKEIFNTEIISDFLDYPTEVVLSGDAYDITMEMHIKIDDIIFE